MARVSWLAALLALWIAGCAAHPFRPSPPEALERLRTSPSAPVGLDLLVRCRMRVKTPQETQTGDCRLWVGGDRLRFEASHSLSGLLVHLEARADGVSLIDGQSGARREVAPGELGYPLLDLPPERLKALLLGRNGSALRPEGFRLERPEGVLTGEYKYWTQSRGLTHPKVIEARQGDWELKLVLLDVQLGHGEALGLPR